ncbi:toluene hydroxylase [Amycolatopsis rubida]|uniref:propane 2-monooxygenase n=1 Tax=Amycolatopsis rubida TaxID=112413 RepID=A0A1I5ND29_9PSEU|nr:toluene hydroxylase [Amycolatopsis rubida]SFP19597.1 toluene monooxygenase system protein E [Amycolatopsis rubida]
MTDNTKKPRRQRTWSAFGDVKRRPSEYEIVTHGTNWTTRQGRKAPLEQNPSSPANLWFRTYRDGSPLSVEDWESFRDPDKMTYRQYVAVQNEQETKVRGVLDQYADSNADARLHPRWRSVLARLFTPTRYPLHGLQQIHAYFGYMAPSAYITNAATFAAADVLRRVSLVAYRTRELQMAWPEEGFATGEREIWENDAAWQPARKAVENALVTYDWAEAFTAVNLVLLPSLDDLLLRQLREIAHANGDDLTWLLMSFLQVDSKRRDRWSGALAKFAVTEGPGNASVLQGWIDQWSPLADAAVEGLAHVLAAAPEHPHRVMDMVDAARRARAELIDQIGLAQPDTAAG